MADRYPNARADRHGADQHPLSHHHDRANARDATDADQVAYSDTHRYGNERILATADGYQSILAAIDANGGAMTEAMMPMPTDEEITSTIGLEPGHRWDMLSDEALRLAFMEWLRDYEILDTGRWEGLSTDAADVLCEHYWLEFRAKLSEVIL